MNNRAILLFFAVAIVLFSGRSLSAAEVMPPSPAHYFNDYSNVVSPFAATRLNSELADFEKSTSNQIVVAIFPKMQTDSSIEDYCQRIYTAWKVGQKKNNNGAILFIFVQEHKMRIQTGYGLEGALPDVLCKRIIEDEIAPHFKRNDFDGGLAAGVNAIMAATRGEYKPAKHTATQPGNLFPLFIFFLPVILIILTRIFSSRGTVYSRSNYGRGAYFGGGWVGGGWGGGGGGFSDGGGGGGFSGGGGSSGGGGASGGW